MQSISCFPELKKYQLNGNFILIFICIDVKNSIINQQQVVVLRIQLNQNKNVNGKKSHFTTCNQQNKAI